MIKDLNENFSSAQAVTSTAISTNVLDLNPSAGPNALQNVGVGEHMWFVAQTKVAITDSGSDATLAVTLESDTQADLASGSATVHYSSGTMAFGTYSAAGTRFVAVRLPAQADYKRYLGVRYTVASGPFTAGTIDAFLTKDINAVKAYASGFSVT